MKIITIILDCLKCRHIGHSGAFTKGGAKTICKHPDAIGDRPSSRQCIGMSKGEKYHWKWRVLENTKEIPNWCPLKHGSGY